MKVKLEYTSDELAQRKINVHLGIPTQKLNETDS